MCVFYLWIYCECCVFNLLPTNVIFRVEALNGLDQPLQHRLLPYFYMLFIHMIVSSGDKAKKQSPGSSTFQLWNMGATPHSALNCCLTAVQMYVYRKCSRCPVHLKPTHVLFYAFFPTRTSQPFSLASATPHAIWLLNQSTFHHHFAFFKHRQTDGYRDLHVGHRQKVKTGAMTMGIAY